ncbi:MAG TPA: glyoxalase/bleomycin resistance/extradiol dioxygenase family protein [Saprospiraceae bacterium]|nr:glyoxalase/bleomycin resistance/extradiol dioxygenase family protein [Saprospiraceae bacterium]HPN68937.1 glyoxalase/bleomycin resistance/extradiol dioxygenase family protein [Saprospiraceae bacterium]
MKTELLSIIPVLPSANIERDIVWYMEKMNFEVYFSDKMYAVLYRENICIHLQWHADTDDDPLLGGSVVRIYVKNISELFNELVDRGTVEPGCLKLNTPWNTNEFGFFDLNKNAIFIMEDVVNNS